MTRDEAIVNIFVVWEQRDAEFCCSDEDSRKSRAEMLETLRALGVSDAELEE